jgi:hypothetical protein
MEVFRGARIEAEAAAIGRVPTSANTLTQWSIDNEVNNLPQVVI